MKKYTFLIFALLGGAISCSDFLETTSKSTFTTDVVYGSAAQTKSGIMGVYAMLTTDYLYSSRLSCMFGMNTDIEKTSAGATAMNENGTRGICNYNATPSFTNQLERVWNDLYKAIERANIAITEIPKSSAYNSPTDGAAMKAYLGEALALRAICYVELVRHWGDVPFKTEPAQPNGSNFFVPPTDRDTIYNRLIGDLLEAETYVPWSGEGEYTAERINKGFIKGLIARICLYRGGYSIRNKAGYPTERGSNWEYYYRLANQKSREIQENGRHKLNPDYSKVFDNICKQQLDAAYREPLFEVGMGYSYSGEIGYSIGVRMYANSKYGYGNNSNVVSTTAYYYYMFDRADLRRNTAVAYYDYSSTSGARARTEREYFRNSPVEWSIGKYDVRRMTPDFISFNQSATGKVGYGRNYIMMRYADVLLMLAETENELNGGPNAAARSALKEVRERAFSPADRAQKVDAYIASLSSKDDFFNAIVDERAFEFGGEMIRKYDLVRWNLLGTKIQEQREKFTQMIKREGNYAWMPKNIYIKYVSDPVNGEIIDKEWVDNNLWEDIEAAGNTPAANTYFEKIVWMGNFTESNTRTYTELIDVTSKGLDAPVLNRHLYPIQVSVAAESNGTLTNGYGW